MLQKSPDYTIVTKMLELFFFQNLNKKKIRERKYKYIHVIYLGNHGMKFVSVSGIEDLRFKREELNRQIKQEEEEKERLQHDIRLLTEKLSRVNESLAQKQAARATFDQTLAESEAAYTKVCILKGSVCSLNEAQTHLQHVFLLLNKAKNTVC